MLTIKQHILGLKGAKIYMQNTLREINFEGMGEKDEREAGETFDAAIEALEKQIPKKVINDNGYRCPRCESDVIRVEFMSPDGYEPENKYSWCWRCGGKINWSEE